MRKDAEGNDKDIQNYTKDYKSLQNITKVYKILQKKSKIKQKKVYKLNKIKHVYINTYKYNNPKN